MKKGILWAVLAHPILVPRRFQVGEPHHITLVFGATLDDWQHLIGRQFEAEVTGEAWNEKIQALQVSLPDWVHCQNAHPHISVSWAKGVTPVESNSMLEGSHNLQEVSFKVSCVIEFLAWT